MNIKKAGYQEVRGNLGFFGWMTRILLLVWQVAMIAWFFSYSAKVPQWLKPVALQVPALPSAAGLVSP